MASEETPSTRRTRLLLKLKRMASNIRDISRTNMTLSKKHGVGNDVIVANFDQSELSIHPPMRSDARYASISSPVIFRESVDNRDNNQTTSEDFIDEEIELARDAEESLNTMDISFPAMDFVPNYLAQHGGFFATANVGLFTESIEFSAHQSYHPSPAFRDSSRKLNKSKNSELCDTDLNRNGNETEQLDAILTNPTHEGTKVINPNNNDSSCYPITNANVRVGILPDLTSKPVCDVKTTDEDLSHSGLRNSPNASTPIREQSIEIKNRTYPEPWVSHENTEGGHVRSISILSPITLNEHEERMPQQGKCEGTKGLPNDQLDSSIKLEKLSPAYSNKSLACNGRRINSKSTKKRLNDSYRSNSDPSFYRSPTKLYRSPIAWNKRLTRFVATCVRRLRGSNPPESQFSSPSWCIIDTPNTPCKKQPRRRSISLSNDEKDTSNTLYKKQSRRRSISVSNDKVNERTFDRQYTVGTTVDYVTMRTSMSSVCESSKGNSPLSNDPKRYPTTSSHSKESMGDNKRIGMRVKSRDIRCSVSSCEEGATKAPSVSSVDSGFATDMGEKISKEYQATPTLFSKPPSSNQCHFTAREEINIDIADQWSDTTKDAVNNNLAHCKAGNIKCRVNYERLNALANSTTVLRTREGVETLTDGLFSQQNSSDTCKQDQGDLMIYEALGEASMNRNTVSIGQTSKGMTVVEQKNCGELQLYKSYEISTKTTTSPFVLREYRTLELNGISTGVNQSKSITTDISCSESLTESIDNVNGVICKPIKSIPLLPAVKEQCNTGHLTDTLLNNPPRDIDTEKMQGTLNTMLLTADMNSRPLYNPINTISRDKNCEEQNETQASVTDASLGCPQPVEWTNKGRSDLNSASDCSVAVRQSTNDHSYGRCNGNCTKQSVKQTNVDNCVKITNSSAGVPVNSTRVPITNCERENGILDNQNNKTQLQCENRNNHVLQNAQNNYEAQVAKASTSQETSMGGNYISSCESADETLTEDSCTKKESLRKSRRTPAKYRSTPRRLYAHHPASMDFETVKDTGRDESGSGYRYRRSVVTWFCESGPRDKINKDGTERMIGTGKQHRSDDPICSTAVSYSNRISSHTLQPSTAHTQASATFIPLQGTTIYKSTNQSPPSLHRGKDVAVRGQEEVETTPQEEGTPRASKVSFWSMSNTPALSISSLSDADTEYEMLCDGNVSINTELSNEFIISPQHHTPKSSDGFSTTTYDVIEIGADATKISEENEPVDNLNNPKPIPRQIVLSEVIKKKGNDNGCQNEIKTFSNAHLKPQQGVTEYLSDNHTGLSNKPLESYTESGLKSADIDRNLNQTCEDPNANFFNEECYAKTQKLMGLSTNNKYADIIKINQTDKGEVHSSFTLKDPTTVHNKDETYMKLVDTMNGDISEDKEKCSHSLTDINSNTHSVDNTTENEHNKDKCIVNVNNMTEGDIIPKSLAENETKLTSFNDNHRNNERNMNNAQTQIIEQTSLLNHHELISAQGHNITTSSALGENPSDITTQHRASQHIPTNSSIEFDLADSFQVMKLTQSPPDHPTDDVNELSLASELAFALKQTSLDDSEDSEKIPTEKPKTACEYSQPYEHIETPLNVGKVNIKPRSLRFESPVQPSIVDSSFIDRLTHTNGGLGMTSPNTTVLHVSFAKEPTNDDNVTGSNEICEKTIHNVIANEKLLEMDNTEFSPTKVPDSQLNTHSNNPEKMLESSLHSPRKENRLSANGASNCGERIEPLDHYLESNHTPGIGIQTSRQESAMCKDNKELTKHNSKPSRSIDSLHDGITNHLPERKNPVLCEKHNDISGNFQVQENPQSVAIRKRLQTRRDYLHSLVDQWYAKLTKQIDQTEGDALTAIATQNTPKSQQLRTPPKQRISTFTTQPALDLRLFGTMNTEVRSLPSQLTSANCYKAYILNEPIHLRSFETRDNDVTTVSTNYTATGLSLTRNGDYIVTDLGADTCRIFNPEGRMLADMEVDILNDPSSAIAINVAGDNERNSNNNCKSSSKKKQTRNKKQKPRKQNENQEENILVACKNGLKLFTSGGQPIDTQIAGTDIKYPQYIQTDTCGNVIVSDKNDGGSVLVALEQRTLLPFRLLFGNNSKKQNQGGIFDFSPSFEDETAVFHNAWYFCVHPTTGHIILSDRDTHTIKAYTQHGAFLWSHGDFGSSRYGQFLYPAGIAVDPQLGHILVADLGNQRIQVLSTDGEWLGVILDSRTTDIGSPVDLAIDDFGNLIVLQDTGTVSVFKYVSPC